MNFDELSVDRTSGVPIAEQVAGRLLGAISDGRIAPGERLPTERDLALLLGVSRGTVKRIYARLLQSGAIDIRQGSGCYVLEKSPQLAENQKQEAAKIIAATFRRLLGMGLSEREILNLVHLHALGSMRRGSFRKFSLMVVSNNHDILSELEQQLSYLTDTSPFLFTLSFLTLDTIAGSPDPVQTLLGYDLIISTTIDYADVLGLAPMFRHKMLEARLSPRTSTLMRLSALPQGTKFSVIYRTGIFRDMVRGCLLSLGFQNEDIFCHPERDYNPAHHADGGVTAVINFNESPVLLSAAFAQRNQEFTEAGGQILHFEYQIERNSLVLIEDRIQSLLGETEEAAAKPVP